MPGYFITLEGSEGAGKSTQAKMLLQAFEARGLKVLLTREPGGDTVCERIREIVLRGTVHSVTERAELFLYLAARAQHTERVIIPHLKQGFTVICARYADSTTAYQGYGSGLDLDLIQKMNAFATLGLVPDLTFLLDIEVEKGLQRQLEPNRIEQKPVEYHERVRQGFLEEARLDVGRFVVIDADRDAEVIHHDILHHISEKLGISF